MRNSYLTRFGLDHTRIIVRTLFSLCLFAQDEVSIKLGQLEREARLGAGTLLPSPLIPAISPTAVAEKDDVKASLVEMFTQYFVAFCRSLVLFGLVHLFQVVFAFPLRGNPRAMTAFKFLYRQSQLGVHTLPLSPPDYRQAPTTASGRDSAA